MNAITDPLSNITRRLEAETASAGIRATRFASGYVRLVVCHGAFDASLHLTLAEAREVAAMLREVTQ
jgi:hypothetical protein